MQRCVRNSRWGSDPRGKIILVPACLLSMIAVLADATADGADRRQRKSSQVATRPDDSRSSSAPPAASAENHPLLPVVKMAKESQDTLRQVRDYSATFDKRERIQGRIVEQSMELKLREQEFSVYLRYLRPHSGREVIYVAGHNQGNLLVHEQGIRSIAGTVAVSPTGNQAMAENLHPISEIGIAKMLELQLNQWNQELQFGEVDVKFFPNAKLGSTDCKVIETSHPVPRSGFKFHRTRLYIDKSNNIPIRIEQYGWPDRSGGEAPLIEEYSYNNLKINPGFTDRDFDTRNPAYRY